MKQWPGWKKGNVRKVLLFSFSKTGEFSPLSPFSNWPERTSMMSYMDFNNEPGDQIIWDLFPTIIDQLCSWNIKIASLPMSKGHYKIWKWCLIKINKKFLTLAHKSQSEAKNTHKSFYGYPYVCHCLRHAPNNDFDPPTFSEGGKIVTQKLPLAFLYTLFLWHGLFLFYFFHLPYIDLSVEILALLRFSNSPIIWKEY